MKQQLMVTNVSDTYGFGVKVETGESAYIPSSIVKNLQLVSGQTYEAILTENTGARSDNTPWFCQFIFDAQTSDEPVEPEPAPVKDIKDQMCDFMLEMLEKDGAHTTSSMSKRLRSRFSTANEYTARELLLKMFNNGDVVKADIHRTAKQERASVTIWATYVEDIIGDDHDIEEQQFASQ